MEGRGGQGKEEGGEGGERRGGELGRGGELEQATRGATRERDCRTQVGGKEALGRQKQVTAESTAGRVGFGEELSLQRGEEELVDHVLQLVGLDAVAAKQHLDRDVVVVVEEVPGALVVSRVEEDAPVRRVLKPR